MFVRDYGVREDVTRKGHEGVFLSEGTVLYPDSGGSYRSADSC